MPQLRTSVAQFALADGRRRNHTEAIAYREPSRMPFGPPRSRLYLLAEHAAANGQEHRLCQVVMREVQLAFAAEESAGAGLALARAIQLVNHNLWHGGLELPPHKRLPIGLMAVAVDGPDAYLCQVATGQAFVARAGEVVAWPSFRYWQSLHDRTVAPEPALGQTPDLMPTIMHGRLEPGDLLVLVATNLARVIDPETLATMVRQYQENVVAGLCRLAEDYGLLHTSGMALAIDGARQPGMGTLPLTLQQFWPANTVTEPEPIMPEQAGAAATLVMAAQPQASDAGPGSDLPAAPGERSDLVLADVRYDGWEPEAPNALPDNVVQLYETLPSPPPADIDEPVDAQASRDAYAAQPTLLASSRSLRSRWLDALAASMVVATDLVRTPSRSGSRAPRASRPTAVRSSAGIAEPLYRGTGRLSLAGAHGFAIPALSISSLRLPSLTTNHVLMLAMAVVAGLLLIVGLRMMTSQPTAVTSGVAAPAPLVAWPADDGRTRTSAPVATVDVSGSAPVSASPVAIAAAPPARIADVLVRADTFERAAVAAGATAGLVGPTRLGPVTVLADLGATGTPSSTPKQLVVGRGNVYVLDPYSSTLYLVDATGKPQATLLARGWSIGREKVLDLLGVTWRGDTLVVMDRARAYTLDGPSGTWRVVPLAGASLGAGVHQVASYDGGLYILDSVRGQVLKYAQGAYQRAPVPWLKATDRGDLTGAIDLAIDGKIYALTAAGQLVTLMKGEVERRQAIDVSPALKSPAALVSPANSTFLYVADTTGRIVKLAKDGTVVAQYQAADAGAQLNNLSSLWVDETNQTIYAVAGNAVLRVAMPDKGRSSLS